MTQPFDIITDPDVEARRAERAIEYGTWECGPAPIEFGGARAFNEGEPVPKSTVERFHLDDLGAVVPAGTFVQKQADEAADDEAAQTATAKPAKKAAAPKAEQAGGSN